MFTCGVRSRIRIGLRPIRHFLKPLGRRGLPGNSPHPSKLTGEIQNWFTVGASSLAKSLNDNARFQVKRVVLRFFASKLAPTVNGIAVRIEQTPGFRKYLIASRAAKDDWLLLERLADF
ncbi:hypothetical protein [Pseudomonas sp. K2I15]|uniref:hypothetical protein n=1 Tax=unclassified Pseudomonas TaxID=196821 RepID=UPI002113BDFC|nr:hypothetical protein [Pseudomonas sp. K2I15]